MSRSRIEEMQAEFSEGSPPEDIPAKEIVALYDAEAERSMVIVFFDSEDDYRRADAVLSAMPADETPGRRTAVEKYEVAVHQEV
ncbi:MAG: hypothetical protein R2725_08855 [Solirubrobacterales bacterium]